MINYIHPSMQPQPQRAGYQQPPPPPRPTPPPAPSEPTDNEREMAKLDRKIRNSMVLIVIFVIIFILIGIVSVTVHEDTYDGEIEPDRSEYGFEFSVVSLTDSCPVDIEVTASQNVDYFFLMTQENYDIYRNEDEYDATNPPIHPSPPYQSRRSWSGSDPTLPRLRNTCAPWIL